MGEVGVTFPAPRPPPPRRAVTHRARLCPRHRGVPGTWGSARGSGGCCCAAAAWHRLMGHLRGGGGGGQMGMETRTARRGWSEQGGLGGKQEGRDPHPPPSCRGGSGGTARRSAPHGAVPRGAAPPRTRCRRGRVRYPRARVPGAQPPAVPAVTPHREGCEGVCARTERLRDGCHRAHAASGPTGRLQGRKRLCTPTRKDAGSPCPAPGPHRIPSPFGEVPAVPTH